MRCPSLMRRAILAKSGKRLLSVSALFALFFAARRWVLHEMFVRENGAKGRKQTSSARFLSSCVFFALFRLNSRGPAQGELARVWSPINRESVMAPGLGWPDSASGRPIAERQASVSWNVIVLARRARLIQQKTAVGGIANHLLVSLPILG